MNKHEKRIKIKLNLCGGVKYIIRVNFHNISS